MGGKQGGDEAWECYQSAPYINLLVSQPGIFLPKSDRHNIINILSRDMPATNNKREIERQAYMYSL